MKSQLAPRLFSPEPVRVIAKNDKTHWERVYADGCEDISWFQARPDLSLRLIKSSGVAKDAGIIDVGGGASSLVDCLLDEGYLPVAVLDISPTALRYARDRLGSRARLVHWFEADVTTFDSPRRFGLWHDRAVFHFLADAAQREAYARTLQRTLTPAGTVIIATFAMDGPLRCSGLPAERYDAQRISAELGPEFSLIEEVPEVHRTPSGSRQAFTYFHFRRGTTSDASGALRSKQQPKSNRPTMKTLTKIFAIAFAFATAATALATNGDDLIAIGPNARALGGTGIATPQDAISAVFANPAAMCFTPGCAYSEVNFAGTLFLPHTTGEVDNPAGSFRADSQSSVYAIPAIGLSLPLDSVTRRWRFGLAAYGVTGLGVDYRGTDLDQPKFFDFGPFGKFPLVAGEYTSLQIMKFAPALAYQVTPQLSLGVALQVDYALLDLGNGSTPGYSLGAQFGVLYKPIPPLSLGLVYTTPQPASFNHVADFDGDGHLDGLTLESPNIVGVGIGYSCYDDRLLFSVDGKWLNWSGAKGYDAFDWKDQWVVAAGVQFAAIPKKLFLRLGYNFGNNPVTAHNGWNGSLLTPTPDFVEVQGKMVPRYYYETFRSIGFPAVVENHITCGIGYAFSDKFEVNIAYMHAFENNITEHGVNIAGQPTTIKSTLSEDSVDFGLTWRF